MKKITLETLKSKGKHFFDMITKTNEIIKVKSDGDSEDGIVLMSLKEYNSLVETDYLLSSIANRNRLDESIQQLNNKETIAFKLMSE